MKSPLHQKQWEQWQSAMSADRLHHAWLLAGREGLGQDRFAQQAARQLVGEMGESSSLSDTNSSHPDIITIARAPKDEKEAKKRADGKSFETRRNITVDQIREMQRKLTTRPTISERRAIIIDTADYLETGASNALLKSLEEPPSGTFFLLIAYSPARLLPTIRSRCHQVRFPALSDEEIARFVTDEAPETDSETRQAIISAARGSPGAALAFMEHDLLPVFQSMQILLREGDADFALRGQLAQHIGPRPGRERIITVLELARSAVAGRLCDAEISDYPALATCHEKLIALSAQAPTFNFDSGLLVAEIGGLLASAAPHRDRANV